MTLETKAHHRDAAHIEFVNDKTLVIEKAIRFPESLAVGESV